jgi:hypothetical protein
MSLPVASIGNVHDDDLLDRVRKLLAKAEDEGCPAAEAEALTAKAAELMARYGIDRAVLGSLRPETDKPTDRVFTLGSPWGDVKRHLLAGLATALRCQCVQTRTASGTRLHVFGYASDLERADILFTSLLVQMARGLAQQPVPGYGGAARAWRRSWMLGYCSAVVARVRAAEEAAVAAASPAAGQAAGGASAALVLADAGGPPAGRDGLSPASPGPGHLLRQRLRRRLPRGPAGGYRRRQATVASGRRARPVKAGTTTSSPGWSAPAWSRRSRAGRS